MREMSVAAQTARSPVWFEGLGEWSWPGSATAAVEALPPPWVPASPLRAEPMPGAPARGRDPSRGSGGALARRLGLGAAVSAAAAICAGITLTGPSRALELLGLQARAPGSAPAEVLRPRTGARRPATPTLVWLRQSASGSAIDGASYASPALHSEASFLVYLPPGYRSSDRRYPVLYLLHGNGQRDSSFLDIGLQGALDSLISTHAIAPMIAVMIQGGAGENNWRDQGRRRYESYVLEVQQLVDRTLPTLAERSARAIAGYSMGGYGAAEIALAHPQRFAVMESWLGFFNGLGGGLLAGAPKPALAGLRAFLYGGSSDRIANPAENAPFASALRAAGASARSAVYPGGHDFEMLHDHLSQMLAFAGRGLSAAR